MPYRRTPSPASAPTPVVATTPAPAVSPEETGDDLRLEFSPDRMKPNAGTRQRLIEEDPGSLRSAEQAARTQALRTINGLRMVAPAMRQVLRQTDDPEQQEKALVALMARARDFAIQGCQHLDLDPTQDRNRWAIAMFERLFITAFAEEDLPDQVAPALFKAALVAAEPRGEDKVIPEKLEASALVRQGLIRGMGEVVREQVRFNFFRPHPDADIHQMAQLLIDSVERVMAEHVQPLTGEHERQTLMAALMEEGGQIMAQSWHIEACKAEEAMRSRPRDQMERWRRANPQGLSLEPVEKDFLLQMARLGKLMKEPKSRR